MKSRTFKSLFIVAASTCSLAAFGGSQVDSEPALKEAPIPLKKSAANGRLARKDPIESRAIKALSGKLGIPLEDIVVVSNTSIDWPDGSLGCPKPEMLYPQVITPGHKVILQAQGKIHFVHLSANRAVLCDKNIMEKLNKHSAKSFANMRVINLTTMAINDLAEKIGVAASRIKIAKTIRQKWPDSSLGCPVEGMAYDNISVPGYRIELRFKKRVFFYHTDQSRVFPCPDIAKE